MESLSYDEAMQELEALLADLQGEMVSMEDVQAKSERAKVLITYCETKLRQIEEGMKAEG